MLTCYIIFPNYSPTVIMHSFVRRIKSLPILFRVDVPQEVSSPDIPLEILSADIPQEQRRLTHSELMRQIDLLDQLIDVMIKESQ